MAFSVTSNGLAVSGATVTLSGAATGSNTTDANGYATIIMNPTVSGSIIATASMTGYASGSTTLNAIPEAPFAYITNQGSKNVSVIKYIYAKLRNL